MTPDLLFLDASGSGIAGDMCVAALVDAGAPEAAITEALSALPLERHERSVRTVFRSGIAAKQFLVEPLEDAPQRTWRDIRQLLQALPPAVRARSVAMFARLAEAEAAVHGCAVDDVHFHEVGALDSIVDIVAVAACLEFFGGEIVASPLPLGRGTTHSQHGVLPLPAPATLECLRGVATFDGGVDAELVTPTGATIVATQATRFVRWPAMKPVAVGWGAGTRELPDRPNVLRVVRGVAERSQTRRSLLVIECNIDDCPPERLAYALARLMAAGARDAWMTPITMKKGRLGTMLSALCDAATRDVLTEILLTETGSLGVRVRGVERVERPRRVVTVETRFGALEVKVASGDGLPELVAPEFDSCRAAAETHGVPLGEVFEAAVAAFRTGTA